MRTAEILEAIEHAGREIKLAKLTRDLLAGLRFAHEHDEETLRRIVEEYRACKWEGIPIPGCRGEGGTPISELLDKADDLLDEVGTRDDLDEIFKLVLKARGYLERAMRRK